MLFRKVCAFTVKFMFCHLRDAVCWCFLLVWDLVAPSGISGVCRCWARWRCPTACSCRCVLIGALCF